MYLVFYYNDRTSANLWSLDGILKLDCITRFIESQDQEQVRVDQTNTLVRIILLFKEQRSADVGRRKLSYLGKKINSDLCPVFTTLKKIADETKIAGAKPPPIN